MDSVAIVGLDDRLRSSDCEQKAATDAALCLPVWMTVGVHLLALSKGHQSCNQMFTSCPNREVHAFVLSQRSALGRSQA
jgi:hypothetical protein